MGVLGKLETAALAQHAAAVVATLEDSDSDSYSDSDSDEQLTMDEMMERCAFDAAAPRGPC